jgi:hypothetical protein
LAGTLNNFADKILDSQEKNKIMALEKTKAWGEKPSQPNKLNTSAIANKKIR